MIDPLRKLIKKFQRHFFPSDHQKVHQRWVDDCGDETLRLDYDLTKSSLVMDLGGYKGQWASDIYSRFGCRILVFEPLPEYADRIERRFERNRHIEVFPFALGHSKRLETLVIAGDSSSVHLKAGIRVPIQFEDVADFFDHANIDECDLMKINIEGGEYELLDRMLKADLVRKVKNLQIQFHKLNDGSEAEMEDICARLSRTHSPTYRYKFVWENWRRDDGSNGNKE